MSNKSSNSIDNKRDTQTRGERKDRTRRLILDAALRVFSRRGILAATTAEVAREAGVAHGSVFVHFGTQEGLVAAAVEAFGEEAVREIHEAMADRAAVRDVLAAHLWAIGKREDFYAALVVEAPRLPEAARSALVLIQSAIAFHFGPAVASDSAAGRIKDLPLPLLFNSWLGLVHHYLANRELFAPRSSVIERRGEELLDFFSELIRKGD